MDKTVKNYFGEDITTLLKDFVEKKIKENSFKFYQGKVVANNDPEKLGRCKIRVYGVFDDEIPDNDLPWAVMDQQFIGSSIGSFVVPEIGTLVNVYFDDNDIYCPVYTTKVMSRSKLDFSADKDENYPDTLIMFEMDNGEYFKINRNTGETEYKHNSGALINIDSGGNIELTSRNASSGNIKIVANKSINIEAVSSEIEIKSTGIPGNINIIPGPVSSVNLGSKNATQPCNNLPTCLITGSPHGLGTAIPGQSVKVPS